MRIPQWQKDLSVVLSVFGVVFQFVGIAVMSFGIAVDDYASELRRKVQ